jgi:hypothetical protein
VEEQGEERVIACCRHARAGNGEERGRARESARRSCGEGAALAVASDVNERHQVKVQAKVGCGECVGGLGLRWVVEAQG